MPAYIICRISVQNPVAYREYVEMAGPAVIRNGGRFIVRGGPVKVLEGNFDAERIVIAEFESVEAAWRSYLSPDYQAAKAKRMGAARFDAIVVDGG
ncbi:MAG: DUF1330 domain-containing protein [Alcaligenaceae bacterium]|nr:MAG: DUF1330 domain-containing protein [Alcaligenaceae bacterium]